MVPAAQKQVRNHKNEHLLTYKVNFTQALSIMKHTQVALIHRSTMGVLEFLLRTINYIALTVEAVCEGRNYTRRLSKLKNKLHYSGYKRAL